MKRCGAIRSSPIDVAAEVCPRVSSHRLLPLGSCPGLQTTPRVVAHKAMTRQARLVLRDCEAALDDLRVGASGLRWTTRWVAAVALLRAVGHVLDKVDAQTAGPIGDAVRYEYAALKATKPDPAIFWEFIERERNNILKVYQFAAKQNVTLRPATVCVDRKTGEARSDASGSTEYQHVMSSGPFAGRDPRDLVGEAIGWWRQYLDRVDMRSGVT